jgi:CheY-like chemotaxis protein
MGYQGREMTNLMPTSSSTSSSPSSSTRVLMVDDEPLALDGYRRALHGKFAVTTAASGPEGLKLFERALTNGTPFPVVVSDMMMPGMNGAQFLGRVREIDPVAVQLLLSGQADLESTIAAVNNGNLFRFLTKPCAGPDLSQAITAAAEQYRLVGAERTLLENTLTGAVDVLVDLLAMASPEAFKRTERVRTLVSRAAKTLKISDWRLPLAAMLSQIGCLAVPGDVLHRARAGGDLSEAEEAVYRAHAQTAQRLLARIPRLEEVADWVGNQPVQAGDPQDPVDDPAEELFRAALRYFVALDETGRPPDAIALMVMQADYPKRVIDALSKATSGLGSAGVICELTVDEVVPGMLLDADVETVTGMTLVRKGERVTLATAMRLANFAATVGVKEPIKVLDGV